MFAKLLGAINFKLVFALGFKPTHGVLTGVDQAGLSAYTEGSVALSPAGVL